MGDDDRSASVERLADMGSRFIALAGRQATIRDVTSDESVFQHLHWGLELVLKGYLQARGWSDARCRDQLDHDIAAALVAAEHAGFNGISARARAFVGALALYSRRHQVDVFVAARAHGWTTAEAVPLVESLARQIKTAVRG